MPLLSIIVPVYNAEKTLNRCVDSILNQDFDDYELILVNDGSTDLSAEICREYAKKDNVLYFEQENAGVSSARNLGIAKSSGEYISFVDSDDYVADNYFSLITEKLNSAENVELIHFNFVGSKTLVPEYSASSIAEGCKLITRLFYERKLNCPWLNIYSGKIVRDNQLSFNEKLYIGEDYLFNLNYILYIKNTVIFTDNRIYNVDISDGNSLSRKYRPHLEKQFDIINRECKKIIHNADIDNEWKKLLLKVRNFHFLRVSYTVMSEYLKTDLSKKQRLQEYKRICKNVAHYKPSDFYEAKNYLVYLVLKFRCVHIIDFMLRKIKGV